MEMKRSPLASSRNPDSPPKPGNRDVSTSPLRYSSDPNRTRVRSLGSKEGIGRALTSIETGAATENSSGIGGLGGGWVASCAPAISGIAIAESPAAVDFRKRRRLRSGDLSLMVRRRACAVSNHENRMSFILRDAAKTPLLRKRQSVSAMAHLILRMQSAPAARRRGHNPMGLAEQLGQLFGDRATEFFGIYDGDRATIVARDVVTDADRDQFDRRAGLDFLDDVAQMALQIIAGIDRQGGVIDRRAVGNHHQDLALFGAAQQALVRPVQRFAVDVFLEQALAHHQPEILARAPPRRVGGLVDDVAEIVEPARIGRLAGGKPGFARLPTLPRPSGEAENFHLDAAALQRPRQNIRAGRRH